MASVAATLLLAAALGGCAAPTVSNGPLIAGRMSVRVQARPDAPERAVSGSFELRGDAETGSLDLSTSLGTLLARAQWSPQAVRLVTPQGQTTFADLPALTRELLGESLPVAALFDWLRGRPWPGAASHGTADGSGFEQLGWAVSLLHFDEGLVVAQRDEPPQVTVRARIDRP